LLELGAYESLWLEPTATFRRIADLFRSHPEALPSELVPRGEAMKRGRETVASMREAGVGSFGVRIHSAGEYPAKLRDAAHPVELLY
jgi:DNA processing protein